MSFNIRNPQAPNPGRMIMLPGQQQVVPGPMQHGMMAGMPNQQYPMMQQGMMPGQMYHQAMYQRQMNPQSFQSMQGHGQPMQGYMMQRVPFTGSTPTPQDQEEMKKKIEKDKKERQFQEQQRRLKSMEKPGVRSGVNPLDDLIGRQLGNSSVNTRPVAGSTPVMMQGNYMQSGSYMQSQQFNQTSGAMLPQIGLYQNQPDTVLQGQSLGIQQQNIMASQIQGMYGAAQMTMPLNQDITSQPCLVNTQPSLGLSQPQTVSSHVSGSQQNEASHDDFGEFLQGPTMISQPPGQMQTTFSTQVVTETTQSSLLQDSDFGSFHQAPNSSLKPTNEPDTIPQGLKQDTAQPVSDLNVSFGEFEKAPAPEMKPSENASNNVKQEVMPVVASKVEAKEDVKKAAISLEDMMTKSTDLSAPKTTRKMFNQKKSLNDVKPSSSKSKNQSVFNESSKARVWSSTDHLVGLFSTPEKNEVKLEGSLAAPVNESSLPQQVAADTNNIDYPQWCVNDSKLPLVYHQVLEATWNGNEIQTDKLYPILMCSNLENAILGHIWSLVNKTKPGQLIKYEMYMALALIALAQNGVSPLSVEMLNNFREAPTPQLVPNQHVNNENTASALNSSAKQDDEEFAPFQEAPKSDAPVNVPLSNSMQFASFDNQNVLPSSSVTAIPPPTVTPLPSNDVLREDLEMVSYIDQDVKHNFHDPPSGNSSCHSSPITWGHDTTRDKLWKHVGGESSSISSDDEFTEFQSGSGSLSLEDRKNDFDDFSELSSSKDSSKATPSTSHRDKKQSAAKFSGKKVNSVAKNNFNINFDAYNKQQSNNESKRMPSSSSAPKLSENPKFSGLQKQSEEDDGFADFQSSAPIDTSNSFQLSNKSESVNDFGNFQQNSSFADFNQVKHSASDTDLMAISGEVDKYSALRDITIDNLNKVEETLQSDFDTLSLGSSSSLPQQPGSSGPPLMNIFGEFSEAPAVKETDNHKIDNGFADFQTFPTCGSSSVAGDGFADFQSAPSHTSSDTFQAFQNASQDTQVPALFKSSNTSDQKSDLQFADFSSAPVESFGSLNQDTLSLFKDSAAETNTNTNVKLGANFDLFKSGVKLENKSENRQSHVEDDDDDFGDFEFNEPPPLDDHNYGPEDDHFGGFETSAADYYGADLDSIDDISRSDTQTNNGNYFGTYHADNGSKKALGKLDSIANLDLKSFDLDLNLGGKSNEEEVETADDSFGDFNSAPPVADSFQTSDLSSKTVPGIDGSSPANPVVGNTPAFGGDRYAMLAGDIQDDARHVLLWKRCLASCLKVIQQANDTLNNISSSSVCNEVMKSVDGSEYLKGVIEIYRVACRVCTSIEAAGIGTEELNQMQKNIELVWNNLSAFLASASILPDDKSFIFKMALLHPEPSNINMACGVCLLNVDSRSKGVDCSEDNHKLMYGGRQYHTTCANLWVNLVDSILPALPFNQLL